jgi:RNA polymerase sigma-70 factor, ECF subfamily
MATCAISATTDMSPIAISHISPISGGEKVPTDRELIQRAQRGDEEAFAALYQSHKKRVYAVCLKMTRDIADAEDLTQEAFLQVFRSINSFRGDSAFSTWLHRIAVNTVLMKLRRRKSPPLVSLDEPISADSPSMKRDIGQADPSLCGVIDRITLNHAIGELSNGCRRIFHLHEVKGYHHHEIAQLLQCSVGNSKSQLHKAKMRMRDVLHSKKRNQSTSKMSAQAKISGAPAESYLKFSSSCGAL